MADEAGFGGVGRTAVASVAGLFAGVVAAAVVGTLGNAVAPSPPVPADLGDVEAVRYYLDAVPLAAHLALALGWCVGGFVAGLTGAVAAKGGWRVAGLVSGLGFTLLALGSLDVTPHPAWMWPAALLPLPAAWLGRGVGGRDPAAPTPAVTPAPAQRESTSPPPSGPHGSRPTAARTLVSEPAATLAGVGDDEADDPTPSR